MDKEILLEHLSTAAPQIQSYIKNKEWFPVIEKVKKTYNLTEEQATSLENEVLFVLLGMELSTDLIKNLKEFLNLSDIILGNIVEIIDNEIILQFIPFIPTELEDDSSLLETSAISNNPPSVSNQEPGQDENVIKKSTETTLASVPNYAHYEPGQDPYHEPIE